MPDITMPPVIAEALSSQEKLERELQALVAQEGPRDWGRTREAFQQHLAKLATAKVFLDQNHELIPQLPEALVRTALKSDILLTAFKNESLEVVALRFCYYAGFCEFFPNLKDQDRREEALIKYLIPGVALARDLLPTHRSNSVVAEFTLKIFCGAGVNLLVLHQPKEALKYIEPGVTLARDLLPLHRSNSEVAGSTLSIFYYAGVTLMYLGQPEKALKKYLAKVALARDLLLLHRYNNEVVVHTMLIFLGAGDILVYQGHYLTSLPYMYVAHWLEWQGKKLLYSGVKVTVRFHASSDVFKEFLVSVLGHESQGNFSITGAPADFLSSWHSFLEEWVLDWHSKDDSNLDITLLKTLSRSCEALLVLDLCRQHTPLAEVYRTTAALDMQLKGMQVNFLPAPTLQGQPIGFWRKFMRRFGVGPSTEIEPREPPLSEIRAEIDVTMKQQAGWLAREILSHRRMSSRPWDQEALVLAIFLDSQPDDPVKTLEIWETSPPWRDEGKLSAAMMHTYRSNWVLLPAEQKPVSSSRLQKALRDADVALVDPAGAFLNKHMRKFTGAEVAGDTPALADVLQNAFARARKAAIPLARDLGKIAASMTSSLADTQEEKKNEITAPVQEQLPHALAAIILGDAQDVLEAAIREQLDREYPIDMQGTASDASQQIKRRFSRLISVHPGTSLHGRLSERLHSLCQRMLDLLMLSAPPLLESIWDVLERSRVALNGIAVNTPTIEWENETGIKLLAALADLAEKEPEGHWPMPNLWLGWLKEYGLIPQVPPPEECRKRLQDAEELIQLFFSPDGNKLHALCLTRHNGLKLHTIEGAGLQDWNNILAAWSKWLKKLTPLSWRTWDQVMGSGLVKTLAQWLRGRTENGKTRLVVIFPAPLAQLPWEALDEIPAGLLERAVSLHSWRRELQAQDSIYQGGVFFDSAPQSNIIRFGVQEAVQTANFLTAAKFRNVRIDSQPTAFDIMRGLESLDASHLILHGKYETFAPRNSALFVGGDEKVHIWALSAIHPRTSYLGFSTCEVNLSGDATKGLLGPVGIGPSLIASGVRTAIGPVFAVSQLANWVFYHELFQEAQKDANASWPVLVAKARQKLRAYTKKGLKEFIDKHLQPAEDLKTLFKGQLSITTTFADFEKDLSELQYDPPFNDPFYWAPYVVLGHCARTYPDSGANQRRDASTKGSAG